MTVRFEKMRARCAGAMLVVLTAWAMIAAVPPRVAFGFFGYRDLDLYRDIVLQMGSGTFYYDAVADLHRQHHYPLVPFYAVRLPTWATIADWCGWTYCTLIVMAIAGAAIAIFVRMVWKPRDRLAISLLPIACIVGFADLLDKDLLALHELPASMCLAAALVWRLRDGGDRWVEVALAALAAALREQAVLYSVVALLFAVGNRRPRETLAWTGVITGFAMFEGWHSMHVSAILMPGDPVSSGWFGMGGLSVFRSALLHSGVLGEMPTVISGLFVFLPIMGWSMRGDEAGRFAACLCAVYVCLLCTVCRADTFYWAVLIQPLFGLGIVFAPAGAVKLWRACEMDGLLQDVAKMGPWQRKLD